MVMGTVIVNTGGGDHISVIAITQGGCGGQGGSWHHWWWW